MVGYPSDSLASCPLGYFPKPFCLPSVICHLPLACYSFAYNFIFVSISTLLGLQVADVELFHVPI